VKYADDLVLLFKEETVLRGTISRIIKMERGLGMQMVVEKLDNENLKASMPLKILIDQ